MPQNVTIAGASYSGVPAVQLPKTGGGTAVFVDSSDATASADKISEGYTAYVNGQKVVGTNTGGGGGEEIDLYASGTEPSGAADGSFWVDFSEDIPPIPAPPVLDTLNVTPTESAQHITPPSGTDGYDEVNVAAISSSYVGSGVPRKSSTDLTASGATVNVPAGYYESAASKTVQSGTQGTPTASKSISGHTATITPSCTDTTGYINGTTKTGTPVTVSASELVSGSETKTANGTYDVTNLASLVVSIPYFDWSVS